MLKNKKYKKILIVTIGNAVTGGPEALHHLASEMRSQGLPAFICYYPFDKQFSTPDAYRNFEAAISQFHDEKDTLVIFPEVLPLQAASLKHADGMIWWLSLDNFYQYRPHVSWLRNKVRYLKLCFKGERPWGGIRKLSNLKHLAQSNYVKNFITANKLECVELFEPINKTYLEMSKELFSRGLSNEVLYNPAKGMHLTQLIIDANPDIKFTPLKGFTKDQLLEKIKSAKLYIDLGHHPGRDRLPREAVILGCCLISSRMGAAGNRQDLPIPEKYKFDHTNSNFVGHVSVMIKEILTNYEDHSSQFEDFRKIIHSEPDAFRDQIKKIFNS